VAGQALDVDPKVMDQIPAQVLLVEAVPAAEVEVEVE
jgi:hypothetical protein